MKLQVVEGVTSPLEITPSTTPTQNHVGSIMTTDHSQVCLQTILLIAGFVPYHHHWLANAMNYNEGLNR